LKLSEVFMCINCEELFIGGKCPLCAPQNVIALGQWLNRKEVKENEESSDC